MVQGNPARSNTLRRTGVHGKTHPMSIRQRRTRSRMRSASWSGATSRYRTNNRATLNRVGNRATLEPHQQRSDADPANDPGAENLNKVIGRIASASIEEIDRVIFELQGVRDMLSNEGERLSHEIVRFASLNQVSLTAIKAVGDSLKKSKGAPEEA